MQQHRPERGLVLRLAVAGHVCLVHGDVSRVTPSRSLTLLVITFLSLHIVTVFCSDFAISVPLHSHILYQYSGNRGKWLMMVAILDMNINK